MRGTTKIMTCTVLVLAGAARAQVAVVNMVPPSSSGETARDAEPSIAGDPTNPQLLAALAFTPDPGATLSGVVYFSTNGGADWSLTPGFIPGSAALSCVSTFCDESLRFSGTTSRLFFAALPVDGGGLTNLSIGRIDNLTAVPSWTQLDTINGIGSNFHDQPWVQAITVLEGAGEGNDHLYVSSNNTSALPKTATVSVSLNPVAPPPAGIADDVVEAVSPSGQDAPPVRPAVHLDGTIYAAFTRWTATGGDVVVVRDDNWATGAGAFQALHDSVTTLVGQRVVTGVTVPGGSLGNQRVNNTIAFAVDPSNSSTVYIAWTDGTAASLTIHVRRSLDRGQSWGATDLFSVSPATNPGLAINSLGKVALLYQKLVNVAGINRWQTHVVRTSNAFVATQDTMLANVPDSQGSYGGANTIGDYAGLFALGKNFYGIFSAFNTADNANFPAGVTYHRYADFAAHQLYADAARTIPVAGSIDPYFFGVTELAANQDFYVRDWNTTTTDHDNGQEPSSNSVFWGSSDVWNRATSSPGTPNASGWYPTDAMQAGVGAAGDNWAFARVRRNATGSTANVSLHFLISPFGTGSNFQDAGVDPDPVLAFSAAQQEQVMTTGYHWHQDPTASTHACIAVQISTANDPYIAPGLAGTAPGWPSGVAIVEDNNKAQRNLEVAHNLADQLDIAYAVVHNGATRARDIVLRMAAEDGLRDAQVLVAGAPAVPLRKGSTLTLRGVEPGESRWVGVQYRVPAGRDVPISFDELDRGRVVNGFTIIAHPIGLDEAIANNLREHAHVFTRLTAAFGVQPGAQTAVAAAKLLAAKPQAQGYLAFLKEHTRVMAAAVAATPRGAADPFEVTKAVDALTATAGRGDTAAVVAEHTVVLRKLDALATEIQLRAGNPADIAQMVRWQIELYQDRPALRRLRCQRKLIEDSLEFVNQPRGSRDRAGSYPALLQALRPCFTEAVAALGANGAAAKTALDELGRAGGGPAGLENAHRALLVRLAAVK
jgi:hypothetical protein